MSIEAKNMRYKKIKKTAARISGFEVINFISIFNCFTISLIKFLILFFVLFPMFVASV